MATLSDAKFQALRGQGRTGSISDMQLQWLQANGATSSQQSDAWREMLASQLSKPITAVQRNDDWYTLLGNQGHSGSMNDREIAFWQAGGAFA